jgi:hypothetical protein
MQSVPNLAGLGGQPWYVVEALGDTNGDGVFVRLIGNSANGQVMIDNEGE